MVVWDCVFYTCYLQGWGLALAQYRFFSCISQGFFTCCKTKLGVTDIANMLTQLTVQERLMCIILKTSPRVTVNAINRI